MSYGGAVYRASRSLYASFSQPLPRRFGTLSRLGQRSLPRPSFEATTRWYSQPTRRPSQPSSILNHDELESFASHICEGESAYTREMIKHLVSGAKTLNDFHRVCVTLMEDFAGQGRVEIVDRILRAAHGRFGLRANRRVYASVLQALLDAGCLQAAWTWLQDVPHKPGSNTVDVRQWKAFLAACQCHNQRELFDKAVDYIEANRTTKLDAQSQDSLRTGTSESEHPKSARKPSPTSETDIATKVAMRLVEKGEKPARLLLQGALRRGFQPTLLTLETVAAHLSTAKSLQLWEGELSLVASRKVWTVVLRNAAATQSADVAVAAYRVFLGRGLVPTAAIFHPILRAICSVSLRLPSEDDIRLALELHGEYVARAKQVSLPAHDDLPIYNTLIRAIVSSNKASFYPKAVSLFEEARERGIVTDYMTTTSFITLLMRIAPNTDSALQAYQTFAKHPNGDWALDGRGFRSILDAFSRYCFTQPTHYASYNRIIRDMHTAGHAVSLENYTLLLRHLAALAGRLKDTPAALEELGAVVRRVHNAVAVEPSIEPDTVLWNQLMDTYQRAGCFRAAYALWEALFVAGTYDNASVSIVIDACAFAGEHALVAQVFAKLHSARYPLNLRNWHNWIEGLARVGRIEEATKIMCLAMPREGIQPTKETARMLLAFAARQNMESEVRYRIKNYLPKLYKQLYP